MNTPVTYATEQNTVVYIKRDDLFMEEYQPEAPALAKLRGASVLLRKLKDNGVKRVGVYDTTISKAGQGIAFLSKQLGIECWLGFPLLKGTEPAESKLIAERLGAKLFPLKAGRTAPCYYGFKNFVELNNGFMLPLGLVCGETVTEVTRETRETISALRKEGVELKSIVVCTGTGTIATGIVLGTEKVHVFGISCGMSILEQLRRMRKLAYPYSFNFDYLHLISPKYGYYEKLDTRSCPFPTSPYYDIKAWQWLIEHIEELEKPILFYNIGT